MLNRFLNTITTRHLVQKHDTIVLGVSGGADSMCMLSLFRELAREWDLTLIVAHCNHGLRGKESDHDEQCVRAYAEKLGLQCVTKRIFLAGCGSEENARNARYLFFQEVCREAAAHACAVAHTADDNVETILMWLMRGTGPHGFAGIPYKRMLNPDENIGVVRPLLDVYRSDIEAYCAAQHIPVCRDSTNAQKTYQRNRIRHELIPLIEQYNPRVKQHILSCASLVAEQDTIVEELIGRICKEITEHHDTDIRVDLPKYFQYNASTQRRILYALLTPDAEACHIDRITAFLATGNNGSVDLPHECVVERAYNVLIITRHIHTACSASTLRVPFVVNGTTHIDTHVFVSKVVPNTSDIMLTNPCVGCFDFTRLTHARLYFRYWDHGDVFTPSGMQGTKKLQDYFSDEKIPKAERKKIPLLIAEDTIIWIAGHRVAEEYTVKADTKDVLIVTMKECAHDKRI